jgi:hypothetical protein
MRGQGDGVGIVGYSFVVELVLGCTCCGNAVRWVASIYNL